MGPTFERNMDWVDSDSFFPNNHLAADKYHFHMAVGYKLDIVEVWKGWTEIESSRFREHWGCPVLLIGFTQSDLMFPGEQ